MIDEPPFCFQVYAGPKETSKNIILAQEWNGQRSDRSSPEEEEEMVPKWTDPEVSTKESTKVSTKMTSWAEVPTKTEIEEEIVDC